MNKWKGLQYRAHKVEEVFDPLRKCRSVIKKWKRLRVCGKNC